MIVLILPVLSWVAVLSGPGFARAAPTRQGGDGQWLWPLASTGRPTGRGHPSGSPWPEVTRGFDPPDRRYGPGHRGVDLAAAPGTAVLAAGAGVVRHVGPVAGRSTVTVAHPNGLRTTYEPVRASVREGQRVSAGTVLGTLRTGHPGCPRAACLHWGLLRGHTYLDPLSLVRRPPVRLLPIADRGSVDRPRLAYRRSARSGSPAQPPGTAPGVAAAIGLAVVGALVLIRHRRW